MERPIYNAPDHFPASLDPQVIALFSQWKASPLSIDNITAHRTRIRESISLGLPTQPVATVKDIQIPSSAGVIPARLYIPAPGSTAPVVQAAQ